MMRRSGLFLLLCLLLGGSVLAQETEADHLLRVTARQFLVLRTGPGVTYEQIHTLPPGASARVTERNLIGNWVRLQHRAEDETLIDGWVLSGYLSLPENLNYGDVPVSSLPDANLENVRSETRMPLYAVPVIPEISPTMQAVYERGQQTGKQPNTITKIGDSLSASPYYITLLSRDPYHLGAYGYLEETLLYYRQSTAADSIAARVGMNSLSVFDPFWATDERCNMNESPLACELRLRQPGVALILYGHNDMRTMNRDTYEAQMRQIVEICLNQGVIPVLSTFSLSEDDRFYWQGIEFNLRLVEIAGDYQIPLINFWLAAQSIPQNGLGEDMVHLTHSGSQTLRYDSGHEASYGMVLQNLLALRTLHALREALDLNESE